MEKRMELNREYLETLQMTKRSCKLIFPKDKMKIKNENKEKDYFQEDKKKEKEFKALKDDLFNLNEILDFNEQLIREKEQIIHEKEDQIKLIDIHLIDKEKQINDLITQLESLVLKNYNLVKEKEENLLSKETQVSLITSKFTYEIKLKDIQINDLIIQRKNIEMEKEELFNQIKEFSNQLLIDANNQIKVKDENIKIINNENEIKKYCNEYSKVDKEKRNKLFFSNQLIQNQNLILEFGSKGIDPFTQFSFPYYITCNDKLNIIAVSDYSNNRVKIMDKKGALILCFPFKSPMGIAIIPSLSLLAISSNTKHVIEIFDLSPLLLSINNNPSPASYKKKKEEGLPHLYTIGKGIGVTKDHFHFNAPMGIGYSVEKEILAISDSRNQRIEIFKIGRRGYEHHSVIHSLPFKPYQIAISSPGDLILVSDLSKVMIYKEEEEGKKRGWIEEGEMRPPPSLQPPLTSVRGIAIHSLFNYCVICDLNNHRILFFNLTTRDLVCSYQPTLPPPLSPSSSHYYFQKTCGISIDEEANIISIADSGSHSVTLFLSPIF